MKSQLTPEQIASYRENGFLAIPDFLTPSELETWRQVTQEAVEQRLNSDQVRRRGGSDDYYAQVFTQCVRLADTHHGMRELIYDQRIGRMCATLAGIDGIRIWHDQALFKMPFGNPTAYHLDNPYWSFHSRDAISIWIALDDATVENGCMWYIPGTHKTARFDNADIGQNLGALFKVYPEWREIAPVPVPLRAGSCALHNGLTAHGAGANMTNGSRRAMTCAYMPDGSTFAGQRNILPEKMFRRLKPGDLLNDEQFNPLIWHRDAGE